MLFGKGARVKILMRCDHSSFVVAERGMLRISMWYRHCLTPSGVARLDSRPADALSMRVNSTRGDLFRDKLIVCAIS